MPMPMKEYDIGAAFAAIEQELIDSMMRNMRRHRAEENKEGYEWTAWQAEQLKALDEFKRSHKKYRRQFKSINAQLDKVIRQAHDQGMMDQEKAILEAIRKGSSFPSFSDGHLTGSFFKVNERKLEALIQATSRDMEKAETAILRRANDQYRKIIWNAQVYANSGAGTYEKAVDMAAKDFLSKGIDCIVYANGARHTLEDYSEMALRTASKRAYLQGEGVKRQEWGITTVIMNKRGNPCPRCAPFCGKVFIDDVWSGGKASDGDYPLLSGAIAKGLYHPRCQDSHTTFFPDINTEGSPWTPEERKQLEQDYKQEQKQKHAERQAKKYRRLADNSLDADNQRRYEKRAEEWEKTLRRAQYAEHKDVINTMRRAQYNNPKNQLYRLAKKGNIFVNKMDYLNEYAQKIVPLKGYEDIVAHGDKYSLVFKDLDGKESNVSAKEFCDIIEKAGFYKGGKIRLIACETGAGDGIVPTYIAKRFKTEVLAPTEIVNVDFNGNLILSNSDVCAKLGIETGEWVRFDEKGRIE